MSSSTVGANVPNAVVDRTTTEAVDVVDAPTGCAPRHRAKSLASAAKKCAVKVSDATRRARRGADEDGSDTNATGPDSFGARVKRALKSAKSKIVQAARAVKAFLTYEDAHEVRARETAARSAAMTEPGSAPVSTASFTASAHMRAFDAHDAVSVEDATPLPVPRPLIEMPHGQARASSAADKRLQILPSGAKGYVTLDDVVVDTGEKALLINDPSKRKTNTIADTVKSTAGTAKDVVAKVVSSAASIKRPGSRSAAMTAVEIDEFPPHVAKHRSKSERASMSTDGKETDCTVEDASERVALAGTNPFLDDDQPGTSDHEFSDSGIPSPRHRRGNSTGSGKWSELSYTTSDDGMLRMCHTSLAPTKPRRWTRGDNLGEGSYGNVWLALNGDTGELFALKEVRVGSSNKHRDESIEQLEQEVNVLSRLVHPNIVRYIGITREETALYIFLEYVPGGSIASLVTRFGKFEENVIRVYTRQILIGLAYLHSQRVVHRDIKGANILVEKSGRIKLADFGMAKVLERVSIGKSFKGSACWMAPEVIRQQNAGFEADIWSVGCTVYEMATGSPPWSDCSTQVQIIFKIASSNEIPEIPEHLTSEGKDFLRLCLQRAAASRPDAVTLLDEPFVLDAHKSSEQSVPGLQYDTWASSSQLSYHEDEDMSVRSIRSNDADEGLNSSRVSSSRHVAWGDMDSAP